MKLRVLFFDIETAPLAARVWSAFQRYTSPEQMLHDSFMLTWAAKWDDGKTVKSDRLTGEEAVAQDDSRIVQSLADLVREADIIVAHNVDRFDLKRLNTRVLLNGQEALGPVQTIDTLILAKSHFSFAYNKLDWLAEMLGFGNKIDTDMELWHRCYVGEEKALKEMATYNKHDVILLEKVFYAITPYVPRLTRIFIAEEDGQVICSHCGNRDIMEFQRRGKKHTQASTFQQWQCKLCGAYFRERIGMKQHKARFYPL